MISSCSSRDSAMLGICLWGVAKKACRPASVVAGFLATEYTLGAASEGGFACPCATKWHSEHHLRPRSRPAETTVESPCAQAAGAQAISAIIVGRRRLRIDAPPCAVG